MRKKSIRKCLMAVCLLVTSLSASSVFADWYFNQSEGYYKPQEYHNDKFGNFPPADIEQKIFGHLNTVYEAKESLPQTDNTALSSTLNQQVSNPAQNYSEQNFQQPAYGSYNRGINPASPGQQRYKRNANFSAPWNNNGSGFTGPWNNSGSSFSGPWNNNGSNFSMPWGNNGSGNNGMGNNGMGNNGSGFSPFGSGNSWSW